MCRKIRLFFLIFTLIHMSLIAYSYEIHLLPDSDISKLPHYALGRGALIDARYIYSSGTNKQYIQYGFGVKIPVILFDITDDIKVDFGGYGWTYPLFDLISESFDYIQSDFLLGGFTDIKYHNILFETFIFHTSHHLGDEFIALEHATYINMGYEAVKQYINYNFGDLVTFSPGFEYKLDKRPSDLVFYDKSLFLGFRLDLLKFALPFFLDSECEIFSFDNNPNFGCRLGFYLNFFNLLNKPEDQKSKHIHEIYLAYYNGYSKYIYFYKTREILLMAGGSYRF
jgi:hypothetical protein